MQSDEHFDSHGQAEEEEDDWADDNHDEEEEGGVFINASAGGGGSGLTLNDIISSLLSAQTTASNGAVLSLGDLERLLARASAYQDPDDEDSDDEYVEITRRRRFRPRYASSRVPGPHTEPQDAGVALLLGGEFGRVSSKLKARDGTRNIASTFAHRGEHGRGRVYREDLVSTLIPNSNGATVISYDSNIYTGQFSADSSFYYTCSQDFRLNVYDMTSPMLSQPCGFSTSRYRRQEHHDGHLTKLSVKKQVQGVQGRWTITDANLSPDNQRMIYSSITPVVYMTNVLDTSTEQTPIDFSDRRRGNSPWGYDRDYFGVWSCRFSADGNEVVAGGDGYIFVYDLLADRRIVKITAHNADVNSCCWADTASGNVLISASDDSFIKVWDRRSLGSSNTPSGVLIGHTEGITYVSAKGDGRYVLSNGKDQAMRLWDLRMMRSNSEYESVKSKDYSSGYDYRYPPYPGSEHVAHPLDCSVMTYRGHYVLETLIRCHFSPAETTGGQYVYTGSADGRVHIYSLDGQIVQVLDRGKTLAISHDPSDPELPETNSRRNVCVRDVSWHTQEPMMMSAAWSNRTSMGHVGSSTVAQHRWKGFGKRFTKLEDAIEADQNSDLHVPGAFVDSDNTDDDEDDSDYEP